MAVVAMVQVQGQNQNGKGKKAVLDEVVVSASRAGEVEAQKAPQTITVITAKEIQELPVQTVNELLEYVAAVDVRQRGPLDVQADLGVRGGTFDQTLILIDGVRMNNPQTGHHNMNLPLPLDLIERIEIVHGGGARVHGIGAMTGVVNIITKTAKKRLNVGVSLLGGQHNLNQTSFYAGKRIGKHWGVKLAYQRDQSAGYVSNTDFASSRFLAQLDRPVKLMGAAGSMKFWYAENSKAFGASNYYTTAFPDQFEATSTQVAAFSFDLAKKKWSFKGNYSMVAGTDRFELYRETAGLAGFDASEVAYLKDNAGTYYRAATGDTAAWWYSGPNFHQTRVVNINEAFSYRWNDQHTTNVGVNVRADRIFSNALGEVGMDPVAVQGWDGYTMHKSQRTFDASTFVEHRYTSEHWMVLAGVMHNRHAMVDTTSFFSPGMEVSYLIDSKHTLYASANRSVRYPTYTDLYYNRGGAVGSITLKPESAINIELGYKGRAGKFAYGASVFNRTSEDLIDWVTFNNDTTGTAHASNITALSLNGVEAQVRYNGGKKDLVRSATASFIAMDGNAPEADFSSLYALDYLNYKAALRVSNRLGGGFFFDWAVVAQDRMGTYRNASGTEVDYDPFVTLDMKLSWSPMGAHVKKSYPVQFFVQGNNVLGAVYFDRGNVAQPGRWLSAGMSLRF